jgi:chromosome segregation ATPase
VSKESIAKATTSAKVALNTIQSQNEIAQMQYEEREKECSSKVLELEHTITNLEHDRRVLSRTNSTLHDDNRTLDSEIAIRQETIDSLKTVEEKLSSHIADIRVQQQQTEDTLVTSRLELEKQMTDLQSLIESSAKQIDQFNTDISILEQKKQSLTQEIVENHAQDDLIRENLASWSKILEERDKNLRIREARVDQKEKSIARNYNLLNL